LVTKNTDLNELDMWDLPKSQLSKNFWLGPRLYPSDRTLNVNSDLPNV
jgi:hypothetical protein